MNKNALKIAELKMAVQAALDGDWHKAHNIAQDYSDNTANWLHALLHKIEGDETNSKYWYARAAEKSYQDFTNTNAELIAIQDRLNQA